MENGVENPGSIHQGNSRDAPPPCSPPPDSGVGWVLGSTPRVFSVTVDGVGVARNAPSRAATADSSPEQETSVVDDNEELSRRYRREERRSRPRRSAGLDVEPLNIVASDRETSDRTTSATAFRHSRPGHPRHPVSLGEHDKSSHPQAPVPSLSSSPPPKHQKGISHRAQGPGDRYRGSRRCARAPGHPWLSLKLGKHDWSSPTQVPVPMVAQTHSPTW